MLYAIGSYEWQCHVRFSDFQIIFNQEYLEDNEEIAFDDFYAKVWDNINQIYRKPGSEKPETPEVCSLATAYSLYLHTGMHAVPLTFTSMCT